MTKPKKIVKKEMNQKKIISKSKKVAIKTYKVRLAGQHVYVAHISADSKSEAISKARKEFPELKFLDIQNHRGEK